MLDYLKLTYFYYNYSSEIFLNRVDLSTREFQKILFLILFLFLIALQNIQITSLLMNTLGNTDLIRA